MRERLEKKGCTEKLFHSASKRAFTPLQEGAYLCTALTSEKGGLTLET